MKRIDEWYGTIADNEANIAATLAEIENTPNAQARATLYENIARYAANLRTLYKQEAKKHE